MKKTSIYYNFWSKIKHNNRWKKTNESKRIRIMAIGAKDQEGAQRRKKGTSILVEENLPSMLLRWTWRTVDLRTALKHTSNSQRSSQKVSSRDSRDKSAKLREMSRREWSSSARRTQSLKRRKPKTPRLPSQVQMRLPWTSNKQPYQAKRQGRVQLALILQGPSPQCRNTLVRCQTTVD